MYSYSHKVILLILLVLSPFTTKAIAQTLWTLDDVIGMAKGQSIASKQAETERETNYWKWRTYQSNYKPQLSLYGNLPDYNRSFTQVYQPDGSIQFQPVINNNALASLSLSQGIAATGASIFVNSQLQRFDDFNNNVTRYNSSPVLIGFSQPLFAYNTLRWDKKIEPIKYLESRQAYIESIETIAINTTGLFFDLLLAQTNLQLAELNRENNENIYKIAQERYNVGKSSTNDLLQLKMELLKAQKALIAARQNEETYSRNLKSYIGYRSNEHIVLVIPDSIPDMYIDATVALREALENRKDALAFRRRILEAESEIAKARGEVGFKTNINATLGYSKAASTISDAYKSPQNLTTVLVEFNLPIMNWGRARSRLETSRANKKLIEYTVEQDRNDFERDIYTQVNLLNMLKEQLKLTKEAEDIAQQRYQIAKDRYILGNLSITDLSLALQEKDLSKQDYITSLRNFWTAHYTIRNLTLYDFLKNEKITVPASNERALRNGSL
ncbi:TolC family protein [Xanthocytophaga agilis]|uniref:TolC family protein n=1 Tax=Xanthocytophaga agilis TaxID=3048010 RepID=A0AAE3R9W9_9BACT|nr:TolC family protein [Xanthocytophaga agilis]MDJ1504159.1 TolC family protein [Xanthocytophaga agilis]